MSAVLLLALRHTGFLEGCPQRKKVPISQEQPCTHHMQWRVRLNPGSVNSPITYPRFCVGDNDCVTESSWKFTLFPETDEKFIAVFLIVVAARNASKSLVVFHQLQPPCHSSDMQ